MDVLGLVILLVLIVADFIQHVCCDLYSQGKSRDRNDWR